MRLIYLISLSLFLTACGFEPVYRETSKTQPGLYASGISALSKVDIAVVPNREGQAVRNHLIDRFYKDGFPISPNYYLKIAPIRERIVEIGIDRDDEASRAQLRQETDIALFDQKQNVVLNRTVRATTGYNILAGQFTTFVTEEDARNQAQKILADNITTQLELYFNR